MNSVVIWTSRLSWNFRGMLIYKQIMLSSIRVWKMTSHPNYLIQKINDFHPKKIRNSKKTYFHGRSNFRCRRHAFRLYHANQKKCEKLFFVSSHISDEVYNRSKRSSVNTTLPIFLYWKLFRKHSLTILENLCIECDYRIYSN